MADRTHHTQRTTGNGRGEGHHHHTYGGEERADTGGREEHMGAETGRLYRAAQDRSEASRREDTLMGMGYARGGGERGRVYADEEHRWQPRRDFREESRTEGYYDRPRFEGGPEWRRQGMEDFGYPSVGQGRELRERMGNRGFEGRDDRFAGRSGMGYRTDVQPGYTPPEEEWERAHYGYRDRAEDRRRREFWERESLEVSEVMTKNPRAVAPDANLKEVARLMHDEDTGIVPVVDGTRRVLGLITDRDMVIRTYDQDMAWTGLRASDVMTDDVWAVTPEDKVHHVIELMGRKQVRRIPVVDRNDRLVGMISTADIATRAHQDEELQHALERISRRRTFWSRMWH